MPSTNRNAPSAGLGSVLFAAAAGVIAAMILLILYEDWTWMGAAGIGALIAGIVLVVLLVMFRKPLPPMGRSADALEPVGGLTGGARLADGGSGPHAGEAVGLAAGQGTRTLDAATSAGTASAPAAAQPATAASRSPLDPAEMPLPGAGDPSPPVGGSGGSPTDAMAERGPAVEPAAGAPTEPAAPVKGALDGGTVASEGAPNASTSGLSGDVDTTANAGETGSDGFDGTGDRIGGGDPGGVDPMMPAADSASTGAANEADARAAFGSEAGGGDPGGIDPMMPDADASREDGRDDARAAFGAVPGGGDPGGVDPMMPTSDRAGSGGESEADVRAAFAAEDGGGDPGGADPMMPAAGSGSSSASADARAAFDPAAGKAPGALDRARDGGADDLKLIKGVGPKLEAMLHGMGIYHFDQIAGWGADEIAWADSNLEGFKGRVSRDDWVGQSQILSSGGTTEFSRRNDDDPNT